MRMRIHSFHSVHLLFVFDKIDERMTNTTIMKTSIFGTSSTFSFDIKCQYIRPAMGIVWKSEGLILR